MDPLEERNENLKHGSKYATVARKFSLRLNPLYATVKYGALMYGIRAVVGDNIDWNKLITAGVFYAAASLSDYYIKNEVLEAQHKIMMGRMDNLEKILKQ